MMKYFQDNVSKVVLPVGLEWDIQEMRKHPEYSEVSEAIYLDYLKKIKAEQKGNK